jgi:ABC-type branched-subunit amino acid transport system ATPase component
MCFQKENLSIEVILGEQGAGETTTMMGLSRSGGIVECGSTILPILLIN